MLETAPYPGSSSLSHEAREKVLQTFQHTLELARGGRNEEALLGCDFILKMDLRFLPARQLLDSLRGVSAGTIVDLSPFASAATGREAGRPAPEAPSAPEPIEVPSDLSFGSRSPLPPSPEKLGEPALPLPLTPVPAALESLRLDSFGSANPFDPAPAQLFGPTDPPAPAVPSPLASPDHDPFSLSAPDPFATPPSIPSVREATVPPPPASPPVEPPSFSHFDGPVGDPFAGLGPVEESISGGFPDFGLGAPSVGSSVPPRQDIFAPGPLPTAVPAPARASAPAATSDPRVLQFLKQGDDAMARGQIQEAIDLWSRVFLIDLSNDEASKRIDAAREKQAQTSQAIDVLLSEGIQLFDSRDLVSARSKFLDVLALSESEPTARNYLNQIESALSQNESSASPFRGSGSDFLSDMTPSASLKSGEAAGLFEPGSSSSLGDEQLAPGTLVPPSSQTSAAEPVKKVIRIDLRIVTAATMAVVALVGGGIFLSSRKKPAPPPPVPNAASAPKVVGEDLIAKAQALFNQGKADEALQILVSIPDADPRHRDALALIDKFKSSAVPGLPSAAPSAASIDEMRLAGFAAISANRYIEAVKALDPVVKARPDDTEAAQALTRAREHLSALASAVRSYNEQDYESAIKLLWDLRKKDMKNQDVEEFLFKAYFNEGIQDLQAGNSKKAATSFQEATALRQSDAEAARHLRFSKKYSQGTNDILSRIYVKNALPRP